MEPGGPLVSCKLWPPHTEGKQQGVTKWSGKPLYIFPLLFLSHSFSPTHSSSGFPALCFFFFLLISHSLTLIHDSPLLTPCFRSFDQAYIFPSLPSFRTLSPCHFLFPVRQFPFFLCRCTKMAPWTAVCHLAELQVL